MTGPVSARPPAGVRGSDLALVGVLAVPVLVGTAIWAAGQVSAVLGSGRWPAAGGFAGAVQTGVGVLLQHPGDPARAWPAAARPDIGGPVLVWTLVAVQLLTATALVWAALLVAGRRRGRHRLPSADGLASARDLAEFASERSLARRAEYLRPSTKTAPPASPGGSVGFVLGRDTVTGRQVWSSVEDSTLIVGPPRAGKGVGIVIPLTVAAHGAAIVPSTRPDTYRQTSAARGERGPVYLWDPQDMTGDPTSLRWSPVSGCEDPLRAILRARALEAGGAEGVTDARFWSRQTQAVLRCYLHAAALAERSMQEVLHWTAYPEDSTPIEILRSHPKAAQTWAQELSAQAATTPRQRDSVWTGVRSAWDALADPRVLAACTPPPGQQFRAEKFLDEQATLYLVGSPDAQLSLAPLITALIEDIVGVARLRAAGSENGRLDPPLSLILDEAANIAPLPSLAGLLSDGGGAGIFTAVVLQSLSQARDRWSPEAARAMWGASTAKLILGGLSDKHDLAEISALAGERDETVISRSSGWSGSSASTALRRVPVLPLEFLRHLPEGRAVLLIRHLPPVVLELIGHRHRSRQARRWLGRARPHKQVLGPPN